MKQTLINIILPILIMALTLNAGVLFSQNFTEDTLGISGVWNSDADWGDYDNDGDLDILITGLSTAKIYKNENDSFILLSNPGLNGVIYGSARWGDYDNDNDLDILMTGNFAGLNEVRIYSNNGDNTFSIISSHSIKAHGHNGTWTDYDNDGDLDIILPSAINETKILINYNNGIFKKPYYPFVGDSIDVSSIICFDYDKDGDKDFLLSGEDGSTAYTTRLYRRDNDNFEFVNSGIIDVSKSSIAYSDYDNDGDMDIAISGLTNSAGYTTKIYQNNNGTFTDIVAGIHGVAYGSVSWGDYDNDGDMDLLLSGKDNTSAEKYSSVYRNDNGSFIDINAEIEWLNQSTTKWGDYDNDGDLDIFVSGQDTNYQIISKIYKNNNLTTNTSPTPPLSLQSSVNGNSATLFWTKGYDNESNKNALSYNIMISRLLDSQVILPAMADESNGNRRISRTGNTGADTSLTINCLEPGMYTWKIQTIDNSYASSLFSMNIFSISADSIDFTYSSSPSDISACITDTVSFIITTDKAVDTYQWQKNGIDIVGATDSILQMNSVSLSDSGIYKCIIINDCCLDTSSSGKLSVFSTTIAEAGANDSICFGDSITLSASGGDTYLWSTGDSISSTTISPISTSTYYVSVTNISCPLDIDSVIITVNELPIPNKSDNDSLCVGDSIKIFAGGGSSYLWSDNGKTDDTIYVSPVTSTYYFVTVFDSYACQQTDTIHITAKILPSAWAGNDLSLCNGNSVNLHATGGDMYQWSSASSLSDSLIFNPIANPITNTTYTLTVTDSYGCSDTDDLLITIKQSPTTIIGTTNNTICLNDSTIIYASGGTSYNWDYNNHTSDSIMVSPIETTSYSVTISENGCTNSDEIVIDVNESPLVSVQPLSQARCLGEEIIFYVSASGGNLNYQWMKNGSDISGATDSIYTIDYFIFSDTLEYDCYISNSCSNTLSNGAMLSLSDVSITSQPNSIIKCEGETAEFNIILSGTSPLYQWRKNGEDIFGENSSMLVINNGFISDSGNYVCYTNACGNTTSDTASLTINLPPNIIKQPIDNIHCDNDSVVLSVNITGTDTIIYQWRKDGINIEKSNDSLFIISNFNYYDVGNYDCYVSNLCGDAISNTATLSTNSPLITQQPTANVICEGENHTFSISADNATRYQWLKNGDTIVGETDSSYTVSNATYDSDHGSYICLAGNMCSVTESIPKKLQINNPFFIEHPDSQLECIGNNVQFRITSYGDNNYYQWQREGINIPGATNSIYTSLNIDTSLSGNYTCIVSNTCGDTVSQPALLIINNPYFTQQPVDKIKCEGDTVSFTVSSSGINKSYQWYYGTSSINGATDSAYTIDSCLLSDKGNYKCRVSTNCGYSDSYLAKLDFNIPSITRHPVSHSKCLEDTIELSVSAEDTTNTYQWYKGNNILIGRTYNSFSINSLTNNHCGSYYCIINNKCTSDTSNIAIISTNMPAITKHPINKQECSGNGVSFNITTSGDYINYQWRKNGFNINNATSYQYSINNLAEIDSGFYSCHIHNECGSVTSTDGKLSIDYIQATPFTQTICEGHSTEFSLHTTIAPTSYQWKKNNNNIPNATNKNYIIPITSRDDIGYYTCSVEGSCGNKPSNEVYLDVNYIDIIKHPDFHLVNEGDSITQTIHAKNTGVLSYQWLKNNTLLPGKTDTFLTINGISENNHGVYKVMISNDCGFILTNDGYIFIDDGTGVKDIISDKKLSIFPNPSTGTIQIEIPSSNEALVSITNIEGKEILSKEINKSGNNASKLDLNYLPKGIYFIKLISDSYILTEKIVLQ